MIINKTNASTIYSNIEHISVRCTMMLSWLIKSIDLNWSIRFWRVINANFFYHAGKMNAFFSSQTVLWNGNRRENVTWKKGGSFVDTLFSHPSYRHDFDPLHTFTHRHCQFQSILKPSKIQTIYLIVVIMIIIFVAKFDIWQDKYGKGSSFKLTNKTWRK